MLPVRLFPLRRFPDNRGCVFHMLKSTDAHFDKFGEIYFSMVYPGQVKAWHLHKEMDLYYAIPVGRIRLLVTNTKECQEIFLGPENYQLVHVPHGLWNGFECVGNEPALVANCATLPYSDEDIVRWDPMAFPQFTWHNLENSVVRNTEIEYTIGSQPSCDIMEDCYERSGQDSGSAEGEVIR